MQRFAIPTVCIFTLAISHTLAAQGLLSPPMAAQRAAILADIKTMEDRDATNDARVAAFRRDMKDASDLVNTRREILGIAAHYPGKALDAFLNEILANDPDAGIRGLAATSLGRFGAAENLSPLLAAAAGDRLTSQTIGDVGTSSASARRNAVFAVAELAGRFPAGREKAEAGLRALTIPAKGFERENLADARQQALYQLTRDKEILAPFLKKLSDPSATVRRDGVAAFQFFKLDKAPAELVAMLKDSDRDVRSCTAEALGEIRDPQTLDALKAAASDPLEDVQVRGNAIQSIGFLKRPETAGYIESLIADKDPTIRGIAAVALYHITGRKVKEFPEGYRVD